MVTLPPGVGGAKAPVVADALLWGRGMRVRAGGVGWLLPGLWGFAGWGWDTGFVPLGTMTLRVKYQKVGTINSDTWF